LLEDGAALFAAEPDHQVTHDPGGAGVGGQRAFLDDLVNGIVANTADEAGLSVEDVLKQLVLRITAVDGVQSARLQGGTELLFFVAIAVGDRGLTRHAFEDVEVQVELGGAMLLVHPQSPGHLRQGGQEAAIDGRQTAQNFGVLAGLQRQSLLG
jgi:hypothetical protein